MSHGQYQRSLGTGVGDLGVVPVLLTGQRGAGPPHSPSALCRASVYLAPARAAWRAFFAAVDLLCIDGLRYMELDRQGAEMLFQVLTEREEKASVAIASNESFSGWTKDVH